MISNDKKKKFSIVVPVYQNEDNLEQTIPKLLSLEKNLPGYELELVFVDDGSTDNSVSIINKYHWQHGDRITLVKLTRNFGQTPATQAGLRESKGDCIGIISADLQEPYELFVNMVGIWAKGKKLVLAERDEREESKGHTIVSSLYWKFVSKYAVKEFPLGGFDFCVMDRQIRDDLVQINEKNTSIFPLIFWLGYEYQILRYNRKLRTAGKSQWTLKKKINLTIDTIIGFTYLPLRFVSILGFFTSFLAFLYLLYILFRWFFIGSTVEGWTSITILILVFGGLVLLSLGVLGEYIWRILEETRKRPAYLIDSVTQKRDCNE